MDRTKIEWTDATWNPLRGCSRVSEGCRNCYAESVAARFSDEGQPYHGLAKRTAGGPRWTNEVQTFPHLLEWPLTKRGPLRIFVNSMSDLFHEKVPASFIAEVFGVMAVAGADGAFHRKADGVDVSGYWTTSDGQKVPLKWPRHLSGPHTFQVLTKRPERMHDLLRNPDFRSEVAAAAYRWAHDRKCAGQLADAIHFEGRAQRLWPLPNVWMGVSAEDQPTWDERTLILRAVPAAVRFVSAEPLLGPIDAREGLTGTGRPDWIIVGGESGRNARPMHPQWAREIRDQCEAAGVAFHFKQWGEWIPFSQSGAGRWERTNRCGIEPVGRLFSGDRALYAGRHLATRFVEPGAEGVYRVGKMASGRELDGRTHDGFPVDNPVDHGWTAAPGGNLRANGVAP